MAKRLREKVASTPLSVGRGEELRVTVCIGGAQACGDDRTPNDLLEHAGRALEVAEGQGRVSANEREKSCLGISGRGNEAC